MGQFSDNANGILGNSEDIATKEQLGITETTEETKQAQIFTYKRPVKKQENRKTLCLKIPMELYKKVLKEAGEGNVTNFFTTLANEYFKNQTTEK